MTQISIIAVGRMKAGALSDLADIYLKRFSAFGAVRIVEIEARDKLREAEAMSAKIPSGATIVALDERGKTMGSAAFAAWIGKQQTDAAQSLVFAIGGADGLDESIREKATLVLAFGQMTWPHMLARVMLLEQLYRAQQILAGHPYHRE